MSWRPPPPPRLPANFPSLRSYFYPKRPPPPPTLTHAHLQTISSHLPAPLLETLLLHTPVLPEPIPLTPEEEHLRELRYRAPARKKPGSKKRPTRDEPPGLDDHADEARREIQWGLIRGLGKELRRWESKHGQEGKMDMWKWLRRTLELEKEKDWIRARIDGGVEGRIAYGWELLAAMKRHRDDPGFVQRMQDRVSARADARKIVYEKRKENNPTGGPIPGASKTTGRLTGSIMMPSRLHDAVPRMKPQPLNLSMMIWSRDRKQSEAFRVMSIKTQAEANPKDAALQAEIASPIYKLHLQKAQQTLRIGRWRESLPIPPALVVKTMHYRAQTDAYKHEKRLLEAARRKEKFAARGDARGGGAGGVRGEREGEGGEGYGIERGGRREGGGEGRVLVRFDGVRGKMAVEEVMREWEAKGEEEKKRIEGMRREKEERKKKKEEDGEEVD